MAQIRDQRSDKSTATDKPALARQGVTSRSLIIGAIGALVIALGAPYGQHVLRGSYMALDHNVPAAVALLFLLVAGPNLLLLRFLKRIAFSTAEIIVVYGMMTVASPLASVGLTDYLLVKPTGVYYYANPSNKWAEIIIPQMPPWLVPSGAAPDAPVITHMYEGMPAGAAVPWHAWLPMLVAWLPFLLCLYVVMICLAVLLRKQWVENEHLIYPANYLPLALAGAHTQGRPAILGQRLFWLGFGSACVVNTLAVLHNWFPTVPYWRPFTFIPAPFLIHDGRFIIYVNIAMLGFLYLASSDVTFSLFFFNLLQQGTVALLMTFGVTGPETLLGSATRSPIFFYLNGGAFLALVASGLWIGRGHLQAIWTRVKGERGPLDDTEEILPYRVAFWLAVAGLGAMVVWLTASGVPPFVLSILLILSLANYIGVTRIVAETGLTKAMAPAPATAMTAALLGWGPLGARGIVALGLADVWARDTRTFVMCQVSHTLQMADFVKHNKARLLWAFGIGILVAMAAAIWLMTTYAYGNGGLTMENWTFQGGPLGRNKALADWIARQPRPSGSGMALASLGAGIYMILTIMRFRFIRWPLHPLGFAACGLSDMDWLWFTCFLAWLVKSLALRYGGLKTYQALRPAFLGLIAGSYTFAAIWLIVDQLTGHTGNRIIMSS